MGDPADRRRNGPQRITALTAETWGCSRRNARDLVAKAHADWIEAFNHEDINTRDLLFQQVGRLERIARKAENCGQFSAAVGAITALNRMMTLGADQRRFPGHRMYPSGANRLKRSYGATLVTLGHDNFTLPCQDE